MRPIIAEIHLDHLASNARYFSENGRRPIYGVVKANAYGHGYAEVCSSINEYVFGFCVASIDEAIALREIGIQKDILLLEGVFCYEEIQLAIFHDLSIVVHSQYQLEWLERIQKIQQLRIWIKVDTGMGRLGFFPFEVGRVATLLSKLNCQFGLMTHLATADVTDDRYVYSQTGTFNKLMTEFSLGRSYANSAYSINYKTQDKSVARIGLGLYGVNPSISVQKTQLNPVMSLKSRIISIKVFKEGMYIGYSCTYKTSSVTRIGVVASGYADGYPRLTDLDSVVFVNGQHARIVGRVSMDMMMIDLTDIPANVGDEVELWGENISVNQVARSAKTIGYELLTKVTSRVPRVYI